MLFFPKVVKCADVDCGFTLFRNKGGKELSDKQLAELLTKSTLHWYCAPTSPWATSSPTRNHPKANLPNGNKPSCINPDLMQDKAVLDVP